MAFCTNCGAQVQGPFCGKCGAPAPKAGVSAPGAPASVAPPGAAVPPPPVAAAPPPPAAATPAVGPAAAAKTSPLVWILGGCFGLLVLGAIVGGMSMYYIAHKARQAAYMIQKNPALAVTRM